VRPPAECSRPNVPFPGGQLPHLVGQVVGEGAAQPGGPLRCLQRVQLRPTWQASSNVTWTTPERSILFRSAGPTCSRASRADSSADAPAPPDDPPPVVS